MLSGQSPDPLRHHQLARWALDSRLSPKTVLGRQSSNDVWETRNRTGPPQEHGVYSYRGTLGSASANARAFGSRADRGAVNMDSANPIPADAVFDGAAGPRRVVAKLTPRLSTFSGNFERFRSADGVGDETLFVCKLVDLLQPFGRWWQGSKRDLEMENHASHRQLPIQVLLQESYRFILVAIHDQPLSSSDGEKRGHMTARECRNKCEARDLYTTRHPACSPRPSGAS